MELLYLGGTIVFVLILFVGFKRPMYEIMFLTFVFVSLVSGNISNMWRYISDVSQNYILCVIMSFIAFSCIAKSTGVVEDLSNIALAIVGRFSGGAGYVALLVSVGMGALSGSAPGNAASIGSITIPLMKRSGFSPELAASAQASFSSLGPVIPPSGTLVAAFALLTNVFPNIGTFSQFWVLMWGISLWLIVQRIITLYFFVRLTKIGPIPKGECISLKEAWRKGWKSVGLPIIIIVPFVLDCMFSNTLIVARLGNDGATTLSNSLLVLVPAIASLYAIWTYKSRTKEVSLKSIAALLKAEITSTSPVVVLVFAGLALAAVYDDIGVGERISEILLNAHLNTYFVAIIPSLILAILGAFLEPLSIMLMLGQSMILLGTSVGINPVLMTGMLPVMCHAMANQTPPFAATLFVSTGIAQSDFIRTSKQALIWCGAQYVFIVLMLLGWLPILGLFG